MARPVLEVRDLWAQRGTLATCRGVDVRVAAGEIAALVGPEDAGASTVLDCMALDLVPMAGAVLVHGVDVTGADPLRRAELRRRILAHVRLRAGEPAGVRAETALTTALEGPADVVLFDGAFEMAEDGEGSEADAVARQVDLFYDLLRRRRRRPPAVVLASRNLAAVAAVADTVSMMERGVVVDRGPVAHVLGAGRWRQATGTRSLRSA